MTPADYAAKMARRRAALVPALVAAERASVAAAKKTAVTLSSGPLTTADLRRLGHPYARRSPTAAQPYKINKGSGKYRSAWKATAPATVSGGMITRLFNDSKVAQFLVGGTKLMIDRDQRPEIIKATRLARKRRVVAALAKVLRI